MQCRHILAAAQPRYDDPRGRGLGDLSHHHHHRARKSSAASSSDDEEDDTTTFRTPVPIFPYFDSNQVEVQKWGQPDQKSSIAPWLLPNNKSRLGENDVLSLSPSPLNQLDLVVETPPQAVRMSSSSSSTYSSTKMSRERNMTIIPPEDEFHFILYHFFGLKQEEITKQVEVEVEQVTISVRRHFTTMRRKSCQPPFWKSSSQIWCPLR